MNGKGKGKGKKMKPVINGYSLDKGSYLPGDSIVITVDAVSPDELAVVGNIKVVNKRGEESDMVPFTVPVRDPLTASAADEDGNPLPFTPDANNGLILRGTIPSGTAPTP
jgi:hypothetical protein